MKDATYVFTIEHKCVCPEPQSVLGEAISRVLVAVAELQLQLDTSECEEPLLFQVISGLLGAELLRQRRSYYTSKM